MCTYKFYIYRFYIKRLNKISYNPVCLCRKGGEGCSGGGSGLFVVLVRDEKRGGKSVLNDGNVCERHESHSFTLNVSERYASDSFILNAWLYFLKVIHSFTMYSCIL